MFRMLRTTWRLVRAAPLLIILAAAGYGAAYFALPQELEADEGTVIRHYEHRQLDKLFEPATMVENRVRGWWNERVETVGEQFEPDLSIEAPRS